MPTPVKITITSPCSTSNNSPRLRPSGDTQIHWRAADNRSFTLHLPNGVFEGHPGTGTFYVEVSGPGFVPDPPLRLLSQPTPQTIHNYIFENGSNCMSKQHDPPPDIVIDGN